MGFLSSLFGTKQSKTPSSTVVQSAAIPKEMSPFITEILGEAQDIYQAEKERGYSPYGGQTIAELTPDQEAALTGLAGLRGTTRPFLTQAAEAAQGAAASFTPETAQQYMSPYQQAVIDVEKREADRVFDRASQVREAQAAEAGAGSIMGSRAAIEAAEAARNQQQLLADIQTRGQQRAFESAQKQFEAERARQRGFGQDIAGLGTQVLQSDISELGAQKTVGEERQAMAQTALDEAYYRFLEEQQFPQTNLAQYSGTVYGNPFARTFDQTKTSFSPQPSTGQSLLSLGLTGIGLAGGFGGGGNIFAPKPAATGGSVGGLSGLPVVRRQTGSIGTDPRAFGKPINWRAVDRAIGKYTGPPSRYINEALARVAGAPVDVVTQTLNKLGITDLNPSQAIGGSQSIKRGLRGVFGPKVLPPKTTQEIMATSSREPDLIVDQTAGVPELVEGGLEIEEPTREEIRDLKLEDALKKEAAKDKEKIYAVDTFGEMPKKKDKPVSTKKESGTFLGDLLQSNLTFQSMVKDKIGNVQDWQKKLADAQDKDKEIRETSRSKRNELNVMQAFLRAARSVATADPSKGFLSALAVGASEGGNAFIEGRMKLEEEAAGDGKKAIDAIKTLLNVETADLKLQQALVTSKAEALKAASAWVKANNIKVDAQQIRAASDFAFKLADSKYPGQDPRKATVYGLAFAQAVNNPKDPTVWAQVDLSGISGGSGAFSQTDNTNVTGVDRIKELKGKKIKATQS